jgi:hypothetical protein
MATDVQMKKSKLSKNDKIDMLERQIVTNYELIDCPVKHIFTKGLYTREIFMPAGSLITSKIHKTEHPYIVSKGKVTVFTEEDGEVLIEAPFTGITKPGTRRALYVHEDTIWTTFHVMKRGEKTVDDIEKRIIEPHDNKLLKDLAPKKIKS